MDLLLLFKAFILGIVEGATEFIPVSSTGHLIVVGDMLNFNDARGKVFEIVIQLAAIFAVCWEYRRKLADTMQTLITYPDDFKSSAHQLTLNLFIAFLPAAILGLAFHSAIKAYLFSTVTVAIALIIGGVAILLVEQYTQTREIKCTKSLDKITQKQALQVGLAQALALIPGISRSGATILGGMVFGLNRKTATEFSFFLAIPIMFAATAYDLLKSWHLLFIEDLPVFVVGFITAFISALIAIKLLLRFVATHDFKIFAYYRIVLGGILLAFLYFNYL
jgi:undecaprenyl-diphosphatase